MVSPKFIELCGACSVVTVCLLEICAVSIVCFNLFCINNTVEYFIAGAIIRLGSSHLFRFNDHGEAARLRQEMKDVSTVKCGFI